MEPKNHKIFAAFLNQKDAETVMSFVDTIDEEIILTNHHLSHLIKKINGSSYMFDLGKTSLTREITEYQSGGRVMEKKLPQFFYDLSSKISSTVNISGEHSFLQIVDMERGGSIGKHYDASVPGYINYKCNISVLSDDYEINVDDQSIQVRARDMYCFEASLYKHWTPYEFNSRRVLLSFGFMVSYSDLGRNENDPRVKMSERIVKLFQK